MKRFKDFIQEALEEGKTAKHGFDLTDISRAKWMKMLKTFNLSNGKMVKLSRLTKGFLWKGKDVEVVTGNNPVTGESAIDRENEQGYASYIGIEGDPELVKGIAKYIKSNADGIKGESPGERQFI